jgi:hypothetical protein
VAKAFSRLARRALNIAAGTSANKILNIKKRSTSEPVYNLSVKDGYPHEFFANGVLVSNCSVSRIPLVKYTGITPSGLNASSDGEIRVFYDTIHAYQEFFFGPHLNTIFRLAQLNIWGEVDEDLEFIYEPLWELDEAALATMRGTEQTTDCGYITAGVLAPEEVRARLANDPDQPYGAIDPDELPKQPMQPGMPGMPGTDPNDPNAPPGDDDDDGSSGDKPPMPPHAGKAPTVSKPQVAAASGKAPVVSKPQVKTQSQTKEAKTA